MAKSTLIETARKLAEEAHRHQLYGDQPYTAHLERVVNVLHHFGFSPFENPVSQETEIIVAAAWTHDVLEDTEVSRELLETELGKEVADTVWRVTDEKGSLRADRKKLTYPKIRGHYRATVVKLADRIANVEVSILSTGKHLEKYRNEWPEFRSSLHVPFLAEPMWDYLERLISNPSPAMIRALPEVEISYSKTSEIEHSLKAFISAQEELVFDVYDHGPGVEKSKGDSDWEWQAIVPRSEKDKILLMLLKEKFSDKPESEISAWLTSQNIDFKTWSY